MLKFPTKLRILSEWGLGAHKKKERKKIISVILQNCEDTLQALVQSENF